MKLQATLAGYAIILWAGNATAGDVLALGIGKQSCASWTLTREMELTGYIYGYWSALNGAYNSVGGNGTVGVRSDAPSKLQQVRLECRLHPSIQIIIAIVNTYVRARDQEARQDWRPA